MIKILADKNWPFLKICQGKRLGVDGDEPETWTIITVNPDQEYTADTLEEALTLAINGR